MKRKLLLRILPIALLLTPELFTQEKRLIPAAGSPRVLKGQQHFLVEGFTLAPGGTAVNEIEREQGIHILLNYGTDDKELKRQLEEYLNHPLSESLLVSVKKTIIDFYRERYGLYVAAMVPIQKVVDGVVVIQVLEGHIGHIEYKGQKWFSERVIRNALGVRVGDPLIESNFINAVTWANRNPFRKVEMVLVPGTKQGETNLLFLTKDRFPVRFFAGSDNTGFRSNNVYRLFGGFNWGNALFRGDLLSYQYTAAPNFHSFQSHVANYTSFLPWKHILTVYGTYGTVYPNIPNFRVAGISRQVSMRYQIPIRPLYGLFRQHYEWGMDWKSLSSSLFFLGDVAQATPSTQIITIAQLTQSYKCQRNWTRNLFSFRMDMYLSPLNDFFSHQTASDYNAQRAGSNVRYAYWKASISNLYITKMGSTLSLQVRGQLTTGALPTAEQFGLGGMNTVRGYYEQQFVADDAICVNIEAYTPKLKPVKAFQNELSFLVFIDYGFGYNLVATQPQFISQNLLGVGPGIRYDIKERLTGRMDYGFKLLGLPQDKYFGRLHFSITASY